MLVLGFSDLLCLPRQEKQVLAHGENLKVLSFHKKFTPLDTSHKVGAHPRNVELYATYVSYICTTGEKQDQQPAASLLLVRQPTCFNILLF